MAEFQEVCKHLKRMCEQYGNNCIKCPLEDKDFCSLSAGDRTAEIYKKAEEIVMKWAAEHPEPVYPTWLEWLEKMGIMADIHDRLNSYKQVMEVCEEPLYSIPTAKVFCPIPADIAQKLGITPKENN